MAAERGVLLLNRGKTLDDVDLSKDEEDVLSDTGNDVSDKEYYSVDSLDVIGHIFTRWCRPTVNILSMKMKSSDITRGVNQKCISMKRSVGRKLRNE